VPPSKNAILSLVTLLWIISGSSFGQCPIVELPSGPTFGVSVLDSPQLYNVYSALAMEPGVRINMVNLSIMIGLNLPQPTCQLAVACPDYYSSGDGGISWGCPASPGAVVPNIVSGRVVEVRDPTCAFEYRQVSGNDCYGSWLRVFKCTEPDGHTESDVLVNRITPPWCAPLTCSAWDAPLLGPQLMFDPPPNVNCEPCFRLDPYAVNQPTLIIDQWTQSPFWNNFYDAVVYWVPEEGPTCKWPNDTQPSGTHIFCRTGLANGVAWSVDAVLPVHPTSPPPRPSTPGGVQVNGPPVATLAEYYGPSLAVATNGFLYCAWLELDPNTQLGTLWMDRSVDGGLTWGVEGTPPVQFGDYAAVAGFSVTRVLSIPANPLHPTQPGVVWTNSYPRIVVDPGDPNVVNMVWTQREPGQPLGGDTDIMFATVTWPPIRTMGAPVTSAPLQVNDPVQEPKGFAGARQFHPTISVDSDRTVHVFWYDQRRWTNGSVVDERFDIYGSHWNPTWVTYNPAPPMPPFGGPFTSSDQRYSMCPTYVSGFPANTFRPNITTPVFGHTIGNYIAGPGASYLPGAEEPICPPEAHLAVSWVHGPPLVAPPPQQFHESDVFVTPTKPHSLRATSHIALRSPPTSTTFNLNGENLNAGRPYALFAWLSAAGGVSQTEPGTDLVDVIHQPMFPGALCPETLVMFPSSREAVLPINLFPLPGSFILLSTGILNSCGLAAFVYTPPPAQPAANYRIVFVLLPPVPGASPTGFDFVSNMVEIQVQ